MMHKKGWFVALLFLLLFLLAVFAFLRYPQEREADIDEEIQRIEEDIEKMGDEIEAELESMREEIEDL